MTTSIPIFIVRLMDFLQGFVFLRPEGGRLFEAEKLLKNTFLRIGENVKVKRQQ